MMLEQAGCLLFGWRAETLVTADGWCMIMDIVWN